MIVFGLFQTVAAQPANGLADILMVGSGIAQALMQIISNKVQFIARLLSDKVMVTHMPHITHTPKKIMHGPTYSHTYTSFSITNGHRLLITSAEK